MRKFLIVFFILLALGGTGFFFGWVQLEVPPGSYGVMRSKTHGLDRTLIREGEFRWVWYKLIPANADIQVYRPLPVECRLNRRGVLPSAAVYTLFSGAEADFSYEFTAILSFSIGPESLISLIGERNIRGQEELEAYTRSLAGEIEGFVLARLQNIAGDEGELALILETGSSPRLEGEIRDAFPQAAELSCRIEALRFPDFGLYFRLRDLYHEYISSQREYIARARDESSARHVDLQSRMDELSRYGDLLTRYPVLLEYLKLEGSPKSGEAP
jgi:hypothetical protein